jgi:hypothetical protein
MRPKERAIELVEYFTNTRAPKLSDYSSVYLPTAKLFALKVCDEIIANIEPSVSMDVIETRIKYWQEVKNEIENL